MNVGIIAACLPTLKPLAANFFGAVSALTSGERYGSRYGSRHGDNAHSRPHISGGYLRQFERGETESYVMGGVKKGDVRTKACIFFQEQSFVESTARPGNRTAESDESILHHNKSIMRTTEVRIS
jgi:hypothetical protein